MSAPGSCSAWRPGAHSAGLRWAAALVCAAWLAGCAGLPRAPLGPEALPIVAAGRLAVRVDPGEFGEPPRISSAAFELSGAPERGELRLASPLGTTLAVARWQPGGVWLEAEGRTREFADLDELSREVIGEVVPLAALFHWVRRQPWPGAPAAPLAGAAGFEQLGWAVHTDRADEGLIVAERRTPPPPVTVRVKLDSI